MSEDYTHNFTARLKSDLFKRAGLIPQEVDFAQIYDCFSATVLMGMEGIGLCKRGEAGAVIDSGATAVDGRLPLNINGGLLTEGYLHGMNVVAEAVLQIQGRCGARQMANRDVGVVTSGALADGSAMLLTADLQSPRPPAA